MIELTILNQNFSLRTREILWYQELKKTITLMLKQGKSLDEIKQLNKDENLFNASSASRAKDIQAAVVRRIKAVNGDYLQFFLEQSTESQKQLAVILVMLTDHTFLDFMDAVYREKLIQGETILHDRDIIGFFHSLQNKNERAAKWTDAGIKKARDNYKAILKEAGMLSVAGTDRKIIRPIVTAAMKDFLEAQGLERMYKILAGERS